MAHVLIVHAPPDAAPAGAVAAVLSDLTAFRVEVTPDRPLWRFGPNVVAVLIITSNAHDDAQVDAFARVLKSSEGRGLAFCFGGATPPNSLAQLCRVVLRESDNSEEDIAKLRASIIEAAAGASAPKSGSQASGANVHAVPGSSAKKLPSRSGAKTLTATLTGLLILFGVGGLGLAFAAGGGMDQLRELAADISKRVTPPPLSDSFAKSVAPSNPSAPITSAGSNANQTMRSIEIDERSDKRTNSPASGASTIDPNAATGSQSRP